MKKTFTSRCIPAFFVVSMLLAALAPAARAQGPWTWASQTTSTPNGRSWTEDVAVDAVGDVYVTGAFQGTVTFGGAGTFTSLGIDVFVGKLSGSTGAWIWVNQGQAAGPFDVGRGICVDNLGRAFVTGEIQGTAIQFAPLAPVPGLGPNNDVFVAQFNAATGACQSVIIGGDAADTEAGHSIVYGPAGMGLPAGLYITGDFSSPTATFGPSVLPNAGGPGTSDVFVARVGILGVGLAWQLATAGGGTGNDSGRGITYSPGTTAGMPPALYITGGFESTVATFGLSTLANASTSATPPSDIYAAKLDFALGWMWASQAGGVGRDQGQDIVYDATSGDLFLTGGFEALPATFGAQIFLPSTTYGTMDVFVSRMNANSGAWAWTRQGGGLLDDSGFGIDRDATGRVYITGAFNSVAGQFGATILPNTNTGGGTTDVFISKLNNAGGWMWSRADGDPSPDEGKGIALGPGTTVHAGGSFFASGTFSPFTLTNPFTRTAWVGKLPGILPSITISTPTVVPPGGAYQNILVTGTGVAILSGPVFAAGTVLVQSGGVWTSNCNILSGPANFILSAGATINICSTQGISLTGPTGDIQVTGTRTYNTDAIYRYVNPALAQISGTGLIGARDMEVVTPGGVTLTQGVSVRRLLTMAPGSGNLTLATMQLRLLSTATLTAMVINAPGGGVVVGNTAEHQRYIAPTFSAGPGYRHISSPMTNSTISQLTCPGFTAVVNPLFDPVTNPTPVPFPNVYGFFEAQHPASPVFSNGWDSPAALASPMGTGIGWSAYYPAPTRPTFRGTLQNGNVNVGPLSQTGGFLAPAQKSGWALVGNPYPAPIDLGLVALPGSMLPTVSVWQTTGGLTGFYTSFPLGAGSTVLPVGQGFYVRALVSGPVLTFTNACRATAYVNPPFSRPAPVVATQPTVRLTLASAADPALHQPEATVAFAPDAAVSLDERYDNSIPNHNVGHPTLLTLTPQGEELTVNGLPEAALTIGTTVDLLADVPAAGTYELRVREIAQLDGTPLALLDRLTGTRYDLRQQAAISFTVPQAGEVRGRFVLVFGQRPLGTSAISAGASALTAWPNPAHGAVRVTLPTGATRLEVFDVTGRRVRMVNTEVGEVTLADLPHGLYTLRAGAAVQRLVVE